VLYTTAFALAASSTVKYRAFDDVGNAEPVNSQLVQVDAAPPSASVSSPADGALVAGTTSLSATASDNVAVDHVDFRVDGQTVGTSASAPYSVTWNSTSVGDGSHAITARAVDTVGNTTTSSSVMIVATNTNLLQNASLEAASGSTPTCWQLGGYGTNAFTWTRTSDAHSGNFAEASSISSWTDGDRKLVSAQDAGTCAPTVAAGQKLTAVGWYKSAAQPLFYAYYRTSSGTWTYWAQSALLPSSTSWKQASWTPPLVPSAAVAVSVGLGLNSAGAVTMDDFGLFRIG
jgi:hypothetical protein